MQTESPVDWSSHGGTETSSGKPALERGSWSSVGGSVTNVSFEETRVVRVQHSSCANIHTVISIPSPRSAREAPSSRSSIGSISSQKIEHRTTFVEYRDRADKRPPTSFEAHISRRSGSLDKTRSSGLNSVRVVIGGYSCRVSSESVGDINRASDVSVDRSRPSDVSLGTRTSIENLRARRVVAVSTSTNTSTCSHCWSGDATNLSRNSMRVSAITLPAHQHTSRD